MTAPPPKLRKLGGGASYPSLPYIKTQERERSVSRNVETEQELPEGEI
jgi:hypothetical protein